MSTAIDNLVNAGRRAAASGDWRIVRECAQGILSRDPNGAEGYFLRGLADKAAQQPRLAEEAFSAALSLDPERYDAAVQLAGQYSLARRNGDVAKLLARYEKAIWNSPRYLNMAATTYTEIGLPEKAWPLYERADVLQPNTPSIQANLAACAVYVGEIERARVLFTELLEKNPNHQRNHYQLARLEKAKDMRHIEQMESVLRNTNLSPDKNIFLYYALGKEYEDIGEWDLAFSYYKKGGDAAVSVMNYDVAQDIAIIDKTIEICSPAWLQKDNAAGGHKHCPIFVVGLPRTGTTLTERIVASHSQVQSIGETEFIQMVMRRSSGINSVEKMTPEILEAFARKDISILREGYLNAVSYRLNEQPYFIDKLPFNVNYLGFIAKAFPDSPLILLKRNPMDSCFSIYKQVFTWAYKFSYDLDSLAQYYIAYERLCGYWQEVLGDRLLVLEYEKLVSDQENQTRYMLDSVNLEFEKACLEFEKNAAPSTTASSVQVRQKVHTGSIDKWRKFDGHLQVLKESLQKSGISVQ